MDYSKSGIEDASATKIQASFRGMRDRRKVKEMKEQRKQKSHIYDATFDTLNEKAVIIQKHYRGMKVRNDYKEKNQKKGKHIGVKFSNDPPEKFHYDTSDSNLNAKATKIQASYRGMQGRRRAKQLEMDRRNMNSEIMQYAVNDPELNAKATKIQASYRGMQGRRRAKQLEMDRMNVKSENNQYDVNDPELNAKATKIQASYRGMKDRQKVKAIREDKILGKEQSEIDGADRNLDAISMELSYHENDEKFDTIKSDLEMNENDALDKSVTKFVDHNIKEDEVDDIDQGKEIDQHHPLNANHLGTKSSKNIQLSGGKNKDIQMSVEESVLDQRPPKKEKNFPKKNFRKGYVSDTNKSEISELSDSAMPFEKDENTVEDLDIKDSLNYNFIEKISNKSSSESDLSSEELNLRTESQFQRDKLKEKIHLFDSKLKDQNIHNPQTAAELRSKLLKSSTHKPLIPLMSASNSKKKKSKKFDSKPTLSQQKSKMSRYKNFDDDYIPPLIPTFAKRIAFLPYGKSISHYGTVEISSLPKLPPISLNESRFSDENLSLSIHNSSPSPRQVNFIEKNRRKAMGAYSPPPSYRELYNRKMGYNEDEHEQDDSSLEINSFSTHHRYQTKQRKSAKKMEKRNQSSKKTKEKEGFSPESKNLELVGNHYGKKVGHFLPKPSPYPYLTAPVAKKITNPRYVKKS